jgi:hypothetical protein
LCAENEDSEESKDDQHACKALNDEYFAKTKEERHLLKKRRRQFDEYLNPNTFKKMVLRKR